MKPQLTFVWWGDGYFVYDEDVYIGKDDQLDIVDMMEKAGQVEKLNVDEAVELDYGFDTLTEMRAFLESGGDAS
jgi:hypothetical protein